MMEAVALLKGTLYPVQDHFVQKTVYCCTLVVRSGYSSTCVSDPQSEQ